MTSPFGAGASYSLELTRGVVYPQNYNEQAEPGVVCSASRAGILGPLQGKGRIQGGAHRRNQGEPGPVALPRNRDLTRHFRLLPGPGGLGFSGFLPAPGLLSGSPGAASWSASNSHILLFPGSSVSFSECCCILENNLTQVKRFVLGGCLR